MNKRTYISQALLYLLIGLGFGFLFPIAATIILLISNRMSLTMANLGALQTGNPLLQIIDTAPFFLGLFAFFAGTRQDALKKTNDRLTLREMELQNLHNELEQRVRERTWDLSQRTQQLEKYSVQLEAVAQVARSIAAIQDLEHLLPSICRVVSEQFGFYHTGIFLLDERAEYAVLQAANSEGGRRMLQRGHRLRVGMVGIVGFVAGKGEPRIALDVGADAIYFDNPDLPTTRSEMALPLQAGTSTIGVLDVQSEQVGAFKDEDITVLKILADQIAVAIENARLFSQIRQTLAESQAIHQQYTQQEWERFARQGQYAGYRYDGIRTMPFLQAPEKPDERTLQIPIKIRNMVVGHISVRSNNPMRQWTDEEMRVAQSAAERAGLAIENARLLNEARRRAAKERAIGDIATRIGSSVNVRSIVETAAQELGRALPGSEVIIQFQSDQTGKEAK